jgi:hypothetical protein
MILEYFLTFLVIAISGNTASTYFGEQETYVVTFLLMLIYAARQGKPFDKVIFVFPLIIGSLAVLHVITFGYVALMASFGFLVKISIGLLSASLIDDFFRKYVRLMAILSVISLCFYLPTVVGIDMSSALSFLNIPFEKSSVVHIGIHNFHQEYETRNCGMFWEPGAFAGYLVLALLLMPTLGKGRQFDKWEVIAIVAGLLTTQSTMGYITGMLVGAYFLADRYFRLGLVATLPFIAIAIVFIAGTVYFAVTELDFMGDKVQAQFFETQVASQGHEINRFGNLIYDLDFITQRPLVGWSGNPETRFAVDPELAVFIDGQGNALTGFWVRFGVVGWLALLIGLYRATFRREQSHIASFFAVGIFAGLLFSEQFTNFPLIYAFLVDPFIDRSNYLANKNSLLLSQRRKDFT